jgi:glucan biosynthesis protein C
MDVDGSSRSMTQPRVSPWSRASALGASTARAVPLGDRLAYLDHLRAALVALVVVHHVALVYGAIAPFYYVEPPYQDAFAYTWLGAFALTNQAWFMGTLFLLAGYFTPGSYDRRGAVAFLRSRLVRLGIPILLGMFVLIPLAAVGFFLMPTSITGINEPLAWAAYPELIGLGPLWFIAMLLAFDLGYAAYRGLVRRGRQPAARPSFPGYPAVGLFVVALAAVSYLWRMVVPLGQDVDILLPALAFPTIAYLPQYLGLFMVGTLAKRRGWLDELPSSAGAIGMLAVLAAMVLLFPLALTGQPLNVAFTGDAAFQGGGSWASAAYALWDSTVAVGMSLAAVVAFRTWFNGRNALGRVLSENSYAVYVIHATLLVYVAYVLRDLALPALVMFVLVSAIVVPACFAVAWLIRRVPVVAKVL